MSKNTHVTLNNGVEMPIIISASSRSARGAEQAVRDALRWGIGTSTPPPPTAMKKPSAGP
jgi:hypothetical protein